MVKEWIDKNRNLLIGILAVAIVATVTVVIFQKKKSGDTGTIPEVQDASLEQEDDIENSTSEIVAVGSDKKAEPTYPKLTNIQSSVTQESRTILENRKKGIEATIAAFTDTTPVYTKVGNYVALAADERALGNYKIAEELLLKAISLDPKNPYIHQTYSALLWVAGQQDHAISEINTAISLKGNEFNFWLSKIMYSVSLKPEAIEQIYQNALTATDNNINIVTSFAVFEEKNGDRDGAISLWKKAQTLFPEQSNIYQQEIDRLSKL